MFWRSSRRMRFCIEFDNATEPNVRFARDKVLPGIQFVHSKQFQQALNTDTPARYLVVKKDKKDATTRYRNLRSEVTSAGGAAFFLFTRFEQVTPENVLTGKIWQLAHRDEFFSLEDYETAGSFSKFIWPRPASFELAVDKLSPDDKALALLLQQNQLRVWAVVTDHDIQVAIFV